jgi:hypothetical protein
MDVIVCEKESRTRAVCEVARLFQENYVPFKMLLVESILQSFACRVGYSSIPITPMALVVGDYNNIFALRKVHGQYKIGARSLQEFH